MSTAQATALSEFQWQRQPEAEKLIGELVSDFLSRNRWAAAFSQRLRDEAGVRFADMVDTICLPDSEAIRRRLSAAGFVADAGSVPSGNGNVRSFTHPGGIFPTIALHGEPTTRLAIKVEFVADFMAAWDIPVSLDLEGVLPTSPMRRVLVSSEPQAELYAVERHGYRGVEPRAWTAHLAAMVLRHREAFRHRRRNFTDEGDGFAEAHRIIDASIADLGVDYTCDLFFAAEREYWMKRNTAARVQKQRQDRLGIGWANHDHHTYRSSREHFKSLVAVWEKLGFTCRERFYAGREAGWGAQVMEQPSCGIVTFNDVDLSPEELMGDFSHEGLAPRDRLGTVGLWCALHGEAFLQAGMHHLEAQFDFDALRDQLAGQGVETMKPFTDFPFLRQAFTKGERWRVEESRLQRAMKSGYITPEQAEQFRQQGAIGSHLENLERNEGFKGFNQTGVSEIIAATDPRKMVVG